MHLIRPRLGQSSACLVCLALAWPRSRVYLGPRRARV